MLRCFFLLVVMMSCMWMSSAFAAKGEADERPFSPDYSKLYYLGYNKATSSSPCIGNPVTPECAIDTYEACIDWGDRKLCSLMGYTLPKGKTGPDKRSKLLYKFVSKRLLTAEDIPENYKDQWRVGDTVVFMAWQVCMRYVHCYTALEDRSDPKGLCPPIDCESSGYDLYENGKHAPNLYVLRQRDERTWTVVTHIMSSTFDRLKNRPEKLFQEGLSQMPW
jgi:hypothetical protein